eukprot:PhM_4_TR4926/c0_g1_i1/m.89821
MLRRTRIVAYPMFTRYNSYETTYPYPEPFADTPYEKKYYTPQKRDWPKWMDEGIDGKGRNIGLYRKHPISKLKVNLVRSRDNIPYIYRRMVQGVTHSSMNKHIRAGARVPDPFRFPVLTGKPSALTRWVHTEPELIRRFEVPVPEEGRKDVYKPYVSMAEKPPEGMSESEAADALDEPPRIGDGRSSSVSTNVKSEETESKPMKKRLFFWK